LKCQKCGKIWHGWGQADICPDCGGKLEKLQKVKEEINKYREILKYLQNVNIGTTIYTLTCLMNSNRR